MRILTLCLLVLAQLVFVNCSDRNNCDETVDNWEKWVPTYNTCHLYLYSIRYLCYPCAQVPVSSHRDPRPRRRGQVQPRQCSHRPGQKLPEPEPRREMFHCQLLCRLPKWPRVISMTRLCYHFAQRSHSNSELNNFGGGNLEMYFV